MILPTPISSGWNGILRRCEEGSTHCTQPRYKLRQVNSPFSRDRLLIADQQRMLYNFDHKIIFPDIHYGVPEITVDRGPGFMAIVNQHIKGIAEGFIVREVQFYRVNEL